VLRNLTSQLKLLTLETKREIDPKEQQELSTLFKDRVNLHLRQMATPLSIEIEISIWEIAMTISPERKTEFRSVWIKTAEHQLFHELETEYGFPRATCRSLVQLIQEFIEENYGNLRGDNQIIYHAISKDEPPGKQLDKIKTISLKLTISHPEDAEILEQKGIHVLRQHKMMRFATEAYDQGGLLVQEDLALLLNSGRRTIQRDIAHLKKLEIIIPHLFQPSSFFGSSAAPISPSLWPGARPDLLRLSLWFGGTRFSIISAGFWC